MTLKEIGMAIGIAEERFQNMPEGFLAKMEAYYPIPEARRGELCSDERIDRLQERFAFFGAYYEAAKDRWQAVLQDELRKTWIDVCSLFVIDYDYEDIVHLPSPEPNGTLAGDMMMVFIHVPSVEAAYAKYLARGFDHDFALSIIHRFRDSFHHTSVNVVGRPAWIGMYFYWCTMYIKARLFSTHGFNFELHRFRLAYILRSKATGELLPLSIEQQLHSSGLALGSAGAEDPEDSVTAFFEETDSEYIGFPAIDGYFSLEKHRYPKTQWELVIRPGEVSIAIHIPRRTDISHENFRNALLAAKEIAATGYKDYAPKLFSCSTWLLSPQLEALLKPGSKILGFGNEFVRFPRKGNGKSVFSYVFPQNFRGEYSDLPEDTSLMRAVKAKYLAGDYILDFSGVIPL